jgi:heterodisulfide reductase subunit A-like polyferredoxin
MVAEFATDLIQSRLWFGEQKSEGLATRKNGRGARKLGKQAVVIGAGMGGLSAAGALAPYFEGVEIWNATG